MRIKTFQAPTTQEALELARRELGEDAVVLNTKHVKPGGILGLRSGDRVELMAAIDDAAPAAVKPPVAAAVAPTAARPAPASVDANSGAELARLRSELNQLTGLVQGLMNGRGAASVDRPLLLKLGVDAELARGLLSDLLSIDDPMALASALAGKMQAFAMPPLAEGRQVIALVGPTGVGKTTTLAKLAAQFAMEQSKRVALVTADTFRIGAVEQLRTYARIMGLPLEVALSPEEVAAGVQKHADKDVVLIDTVGRSQRNGEHLSELKAFLDPAGVTDTYLVVAASLAQPVQKEVVESFGALSPTRLVITKLDESPDRGSLVNLPLSTGLGIACLTAGQNVPQDIEFADAGAIARGLIGVA